MEINVIEIIGLLAGALTLGGYLPQTIKTIRTRKTKDLSLATFATVALSAVIWVVYGVLISSYAIIITNGVVMICASIISFIKATESKRKKR